MLIVPGTDYLSTQYTDFDLATGGIRGPITPSAFPFPGIGIVEFESKPPGPTNTDTIRKRLESVHLPYPGARQSIEIEWTLVSIGSKAPVTIGEKRFDVMVGLTPGKRSLGRMEVIRSSVPTELGGIFYSSVLVLFNATFTNIDDPSETMAVEDQVLMSTNNPGHWGVQPHQPSIRLLSDKTVASGDANLHEDLRPNMHDFYQLGGVFEGQPMRGGMISNAV
jgi:hypothetical protein